MLFQQHPWSLPIRERATLSFYLSDDYLYRNNLWKLWPGPKRDTISLILNTHARRLPRPPTQTLDRCRQTQRERERDCGICLLKGRRFGKAITTTLSGMGRETTGGATMTRLGSGWGLLPMAPPGGQFHPLPLLRAQHNSMPGMSYLTLVV